MILIKRPSNKWTIYFSDWTDIFLGLEKSGLEFLEREAKKWVTYFSPKSLVSNF